jgi:hypothetical protein
MEKTANQEELNALKASKGKRQKRHATKTFPLQNSG